MSTKKYAIMGDVHGNLEALEAVLEDAQSQGVNSYVCVGDIVGYNANPAECLDIMRDLGAVAVCGNHDHYCCHEESLEDFHPLAAGVVAWTREQLTDAQLQYLRDLKMVATLDGFSIVHSTLDMPEKWGYVFDTLEANANFTYQATSLCFHGHTHVPVLYEKQGTVRKNTYVKQRIMLGTKYFINVGSVGQPRDGDPRSAYVIYNSRTREVELRRLPYDIFRTQDKIRRAGLPERLAKRLESGK